MTQTSCIRPMTLGEKIKGLRENKGLTADQLSRAIGIAQASLSRLENDHWKPRLTTLQALSRVFEVTIDELTNDTVTIPVTPRAEDIKLMDAAKAAQAPGAPPEALETLWQAAVNLVESKKMRPRPKTKPEKKPEKPPQKGPRGGSSIR